MIRQHVVIARNKEEAKKKFKKLYRYKIIDVIKEASRFSAVANYDRPGSIHYIVKYDMSKYRKR